MRFEDIKLNPGQSQNLPDYEDVDQEKISKLSAFIKKNCSEFLLAVDSLKTYGDFWLYRGLKTVSSEIFIGESPISRSPRDSSINIINLVDQKLKEMGFDALRSNSIFCTSRFDNAKVYGRPFLIFPFNGFSYTLAENIEDLTSDLGVHKKVLKMFRNGELKDTSMNMFKLSETLEILNGTAQEFVSYYGFQNKEMYKAFEYGNEIYINGKYIAVIEGVLPEIL